MAEAVVSLPRPRVSGNLEDGFRLLCACAGANVLPEQAARIGNWDYARVEWDSFLFLAEHHGVLPLVARSLVEHARELPPDVGRSLRSTYEANLRRNLWFAAELARIMEQLAKRDVRAIPYKGPVLAQAAYDDLGLRSFSDLDLLIAQSDFDRTKNTLKEIGYQPSQELAPAVERMFLRTGYERMFDGPAGKNLLELKWNLVPHFYAVDLRAGDFRIDDLLARAGSIQLGVATVPCLSPEDSLLVLCLHGAKHLWTRLIWVIDIAKTLRKRNYDFALVVSRARAMGIMRILGVSCNLTERLLGVPPPVGTRELMDRDTEVEKIGTECAARLATAASYDFESTEYFRQIWKLRERASDRWRYLWRLAWTPGPGEVAAVALPEVMFPLYRAVRIGRLVRKVVKGPR